MTDSDQPVELQELRKQLAELTRRVYTMEQALQQLAAAQNLSSPSHPPQGAHWNAGREEVSVQPATSAVQGTVKRPDLGARLGGALRSVAAETSLETRVGGQWLNRIGIIAVLVGLSYFLKLAFENNWIGPGARVVIGILAGIGLVLWSERFRGRGFPGFAYSLKAIGIGALYLSLWAAFQFYHLVPATVAFLGMILVTATAAVLSLRQNAELLAALALLGAFLTPVLVSTNQNHQVPLFSYLALLDVGTIWVVTVRGWRRLLFGSFIGTVLLSSAWAASYYTESQLAATLAFASFFFLLYAAAPFMRAGMAPQSYPKVMVGLAVLNPGTYFLVCYLIMIDHYRFELAWLTVAVAVLFFVLTRVLQAREGDSEPLFGPLYLALGVGFLTIAIPLELQSHWNTLGWIVEAGALFWAAHRSGRMLLRALGVCAFVLGVVRLIAVDSFNREPLLINWRFGLYLLAIAALALLAYYAVRETGEGGLQWAGTAIIGINVLALFALHFEVVGYFQPQMAAAYSGAERQSIATIRDFSYSALWMIYGSALMLIGFWKRSAFLRWQAIVLLGMTVIKVFLFDIGTLQRGYRIVAFIVLGVILLAVSFFYQRSRMRTAE